MQSVGPTHKTIGKTGCLSTALVGPRHAKCKPQEHKNPSQLQVDRFGRLMTSLGSRRDLTKCMHGIVVMMADRVEKNRVGVEILGRPSEAVQPL